MKEIKALNASQCYTMINRIKNLDHCHIAEKWINYAVDHHTITIDEWDDMMQGIVYLDSELREIPNHCFE